MNNNILKNQEIEEYISSLVDGKKGIVDEQSGPNIDNLLLFIANNPASSLLKCHQYMNKEYRQEKGNMTIGLEDVKTRISKASHLGFVKSRTEGHYNVSNHSNEEVEKLYSITSLGIFYLFKKDLVSSVKDIILKNRDNTFFEIFVYPYIQIDTLEKLESKDILRALSRYLRSCIRIIKSVVDHLIQVGKHNADRIKVGFIDSALELEDKDINDMLWNFDNHLKNRYNIPWIDYSTLEIRDEVSTEDRKIIRIFDDKKKEELILELYPERNKAILTDIKNNKEIAEFDMEKHPEEDGYLILDLVPTTFIEYKANFLKRLDEFYRKMENNLNNLCISILQYIHYDYLPPLESKKQQSDRGALFGDKKFCEFAMNLRNQIDCHLYFELDIEPPD